MASNRWCGLWQMEGQGIVALTGYGAKKCGQKYESDGCRNPQHEGNSVRRKIRAKNHIYRLSFKQPAPQGVAQREPETDDHRDDGRCAQSACARGGRRAAIASDDAHQRAKANHEADCRCNRHLCEQAFAELTSMSCLLGIASCFGPPRHKRRQSGQLLRFPSGRGHAVVNRAVGKPEQMAAMWARRVAGRIGWLDPNLLSADGATVRLPFWSARRGLHVGY